MIWFQPRQERKRERFAEVVAANGKAADFGIFYSSEQGEGYYTRFSAPGESLDLPVERIGRASTGGEAYTLAYLAALQSAFDTASYLEGRGVSVTFRSQPLEEFKRELVNEKGYRWLGVSFKGIFRRSPARETESEG